MDTDAATNFVAIGYEEIAAASQRERIPTAKGDKQIEKFLPTLEKLETWMAYQDWPTAPVEPAEFYRLVVIYHNAFIAQRMK